MNKKNIFFGNGVLFFSTPDAPNTEIRERTMECRHWNSSYKVCNVQDAQKVQSIEKIAQFPITPGSQCNKGIDFGIIEDSIWINNGCNGIYKVEYYTGNFLTRESSFRLPTFKSSSTKIVHVYMYMHIHTYISPPPLFLMVVKTRY